MWRTPGVRKSARVLAVERSNMDTMKSSFRSAKEREAAEIRGEQPYPESCRRSRVYP